MASFNKVILLGNLTRDPELRYLQNNNPVVEFGMACNRKFKDAQGQEREEVMFIDVSAFQKPAEIINQYCHKGDLLFVEGRLKLDTWEDKNGGGKRSKHRVVVDNFQLMPKRDGSGEQGQGGQQGGPGGGGSAPRQAPATGARPPQRQAQGQAATQQQLPADGERDPLDDLF
jgi:single-strand DNA-binding protein